MAKPPQTDTQKVALGPACAWEYSNFRAVHKEMMNKVANRDLYVSLEIDLIKVAAQYRILVPRTCRETIGHLISAAKKYVRHPQ